MLDFKAAIFDLDGTLLDSMWVWEQIDLDFLAKRNLQVPVKYITEISAKSFREAAEYTISLFGLEECVEEIITEWNKMAMDKYSYDVPLKPHAKEYLLFLKAQGIKLGTATVLPRVLYEPALRNNEVYEFFAAHTSTDEVRRGKGSPDVYLLTAKKLGISPEHCIVFEDVLPGIEGIRAAGMRAYGVYDKYSQHEQAQIKELAEDYIYDFAEMFGG